MAELLYSRIEGQGKPLLILHGFLGMSDNWKTLATQYATKGFAVHVLDLRNHGRSFHSDEFTYDAMVADVKRYCDHHGLKPVSVIGHSMGGKVAMFLATQFPELVEKLVVADIGPKYYAPHHQDIMAGLNAVDFSQTSDRAEAEKMIEPYVSDFGTRQFLMKSVHRDTPETLAFRFNLDVFNREIENIGQALPENARFKKPTLFIRGGNSKYIKDDQWELIEKHFSNASLETIPGVGHWLHAENPKRFLEITSNFLQ